MEVGQRIGGCGANARKARRARAPVSTPANGSALSGAGPRALSYQARSAAASGPASAAARS